MNESKINKNKIKKSFDVYCSKKLKIKIPKNDNNDFFRTYVTKGERIIDKIISNENFENKKIMASQLTKKIKKHIKLKNKTIEDISYIEEFLKSYYQIIIGKEIDYEKNKDGDEWISWKKSLNHTKIKEKN